MAVSVPPPAGLERSPGEAVSALREALYAPRMRAGSRARLALGFLLASCGGGAPGDSSNPDPDNPGPDNPPGMESEAEAESEGESEAESEGDDPEAMTPPEGVELMNAGMHRTCPGETGPVAEGRVLEPDKTQRIVGRDSGGRLFEVPGYNPGDPAFSFDVPEGEECQFAAETGEMPDGGEPLRSPFSASISWEVDDAVPAAPDPLTPGCPDSPEAPECVEAGVDEGSLTLPITAPAGAARLNVYRVDADGARALMNTFETPLTEFTLTGDDEDLLYGNYELTWENDCGTESPVREMEVAARAPVLGEFEFGGDGIPSAVGNSISVTLPATDATGFRVELEITDPGIAAMEGVTAGRVKPAEGIITPGEPIGFDFFGPGIEGVPFRFRVIPKNGAGVEVPEAAALSPELTTGCRITGC